MPRSGRVSFAEGESPLDALQPPLLGTTEDGGSASSFSHKRRFVHAQRASSGGSAASTSPQRISVSVAFGAGGCLRRLRRRRRACSPAQQSKRAGG